MSDVGAVTVLIPTPLRKFTGGEARVTANGETIAELIDELDGLYPGIRERVIEPDGEIRRFVNIFVNGNNARQLLGAATPVKSGDEVGIIPAMAGGERRV
ncbi:MAG: MoaD family protein [Thermomicrobiales bacterium]|nr:MoaD family protein [Thermomicrobiales bacterium]